MSGIQRRAGASGWLFVCVQLRIVPACLVAFPWDIGSHSVCAVRAPDSGTFPCIMSSGPLAPLVVFSESWFEAPSCRDFRGFPPCHSFLWPLAAPPWSVLSSGKPHTLFGSLRPYGFPWPLQPLSSAPPLWFFSCCVFCPSLHGVSKSSAFHPSSFPECVCLSLPDTAPSPMVST